MYDASDDALNGDDFSVGPIIAAFVDPGLTVVFGEAGVTRWPTAAAEVDHSPQMLEPPTRIVNRGAAYAAAVEIGGAMSDVEERPERITEAFIIDLMRHPVDGPMKSNGGGRKRTKPMRARDPEAFVGAGVGPSAPRVNVVGLTDGEKDFYARRPGEAESVLRELVGAIIRNEVAAAPLRTGKAQPMKHAFYVYGLSEPELRILRAYPGSPRRALIDHAHATAGYHVAMLDHGAPHDIAA